MRSRHTTHSGIGLALAAALALSACGGGNEGDKAAAVAAAPLRPALEALGVRGASWAKVSLYGPLVVFQDVRADLEGVGPVRLAQVSVRGFKETEGGWQADEIQGELLDGAAKALKVSVRSPRARREAAAWKVVDEGRFLESYEGPLFGVPVTLASAGIGPAPRLPGRTDGMQMAATGLRLGKGTAGAPSPLSDLPWDVSVRYESPRPGAASFEVQRAETKGWSLTGRISLVGGPGLPGKLATLGRAAFLDARAWPADIGLQDADLDMTAARPGAFLGTTAVDPVAGSLAAKVAAGGPASWHVRMHPAQPVAVRDLPEILGGAGADARLGLSAQVREVVIPSPPAKNH